VFRIRAEILSPMSRLGILVVGAGFIADSHIRAITGESRAELAGVVDVDPGRARAFAYANGNARYGTDLAEALTWPGVDAVIVCTPNHTHVPIALQVAAAGKHLLAEKPLATTVAGAQQVVDAFAAADRVVAAAHTHRSYDYGLAVRSVIDSGAIGDPVAARLSILGGWIWPDWRAWVLDPERSGGHSLHNGVHLLDLVTWWLGDEPLRVYARGRTQTAGELRIYDYLEMTVEYAHGGTAVCEMSRAHRPGSFGYRELMVAGTAGLIEQGWDGESALLFTEQGLQTVPAAGGNGFARQLSAWLDSIDGAPPRMTPADAVQAVALGVASELSIARGEPVELAEVLANQAVSA
jgi:predicted dehydrogenase